MSLRQAVEDVSPGRRVVLREQWKGLLPKGDGCLEPVSIGDELKRLRPPIERGVGLGDQLLRLRRLL